jgi:hypothetical protein
LKRWQKISAVLLPLGALISGSGIALAQNDHGDLVAPFAADVIMEMAGKLDDILSLWVANGNLTDPRGEGVVSWMVERILFLADYFAVVFEQLNSFVPM